MKTKLANKDKAEKKETIEQDKNQTSRNACYSMSEVHCAGLYSESRLKHAFKFKREKK